jgi:Fe-S cluster assembly iron-binding protein IscA
LALEEPNEDEKAIQVNGIDVLIQDELKVYTDRSTIDYINGPGRSGFTISLDVRADC